MSRIDNNNSTGWSFYASLISDVVETVTREVAAREAAARETGSNPQPNNVEETNGDSTFEVSRRNLLPGSREVSPAPRTRVLPRIAISSSVGRNGTNRPSDVSQVQEALVARGFLREGTFVPGRMNDICIRAIEKYQEVKDLPKVDGRIDPGKATMKEINREATAPRAEPPTPREVESREPIVPLESISTRTPTGFGGRAVAAANEEWRSHVVESSRNRGSRIDDYARNAKMNPGGEWCGYFAAFALTQAGFEDSPYLASYQKARDYFMYRAYTSPTGDARNRRFERTRRSHENQGKTRQYFMMAESPNILRAESNRRRFPHYRAEENTFSYRELPIQPGDIGLLHKPYGHIVMVESYDPSTGLLTTIEGNANGTTPDGNYYGGGGAVVKNVYDLSDPNVRKRFDGFGRPSPLDFD